MKESPLLKHVDNRFDRLETKVDGLHDRITDHDHPEYWTAYRIISVILGVVSLAGGALWLAL